MNRKGSAALVFGSQIASHIGLLYARFAGVLPAINGLLTGRHGDVQN
jgi:hypothetical protein